jgi:hypothetical protein
MTNKHFYIIALPMTRDPTIKPIVVRSHPMKFIIWRRNINNNRPWSVLMVYRVGIGSRKKRD